MEKKIKRSKLRKGSAVLVISQPADVPNTGTVTQVGRNKARVLFPVRKFVWLPITSLRVIGFDGDGSSVNWK